MQAGLENLARDFPSDIARYSLRGAISKSAAYALSEWRNYKIFPVLSPSEKRICSLKLFCVKKSKQLYIAILSQIVN